MNIDLCNREVLISYLQKHKLWAKKYFGQNFLVHKEILSRIVDTAEISSTDHILEIGPGLGVLTEKLAQKAQKVTSLEKDRSLEALLKKNLAGYKNIEMIFQDALKFPPPHPPYKIVANIPYYITSPLINHFLKEQVVKTFPGSLPTTIILLIQYEVAQKICQEEPHHSVLSLNIQTFAKPQLIAKVPKSAFYPMPKVDSAIIKITRYEKPLVSCELEHYFKIINAGFSQKRKTIQNALSHGLKMPAEQTKTILKRANIDQMRRAQTLSIKEWEALTFSLTEVENHLRRLTKTE